MSYYLNEAIYLQIIADIDIWIFDYIIIILLLYYIIFEALYGVFIIYYHDYYYCI